MKEEFEDTLRRHLENFESEHIPVGLWEGIEQKLEHPAVVPLWKKLVAVAASLLLVVGIGIGMFTRLDERNTQQIAVQNSIHYKENKEAKGNCTENTQMTMKQDLLADNFKKKNSSATIYADEEHNSAVTHLIQHDSEAIEENVNRLENATTNNKQKADVRKNNGNKYTYQDNMAIKKNDNRTNRVAVKLYASQMPQGSDNNMNGYLALCSEGIPDEQPQIMSRAPMTGTMESLFFANANKGDEPVTNTTYAQPVRIGVSVGYEFNERWGVNVGVVYSRLKSTLKSGSEHSYFTNHQRLNYIGLPINVSYNLIKTRNLCLYASMGEMIEFGTNGDVDVIVVTDNQVVAHENKNLNKLPVQFSLNASTGVEYSFYQGLGVFVEPGVSYHFKDNSDISSIYKAHPLNFNLQMGLRWIINK